MATVNETDTTSQGLGQGILMPKLKHQWRITLPDVPDGPAISMQAVSVSNIYLDRHESGGTFQLYVEDDRTNQAMKVVYNLFGEKTLFTTFIEILNGEAQCLERRIFHDCSIDDMVLDTLNYAHSPKKFLILNVPTKLGIAMENFKALHPELEALILALNGMRIDLPIEETPETGQLIHEVSIRFSSVDIEYIG